MAIENILNSVGTEMTKGVKKIATTTANGTLNVVNNTVEEWIEDYQEANVNTNLSQQTIEDAFTTLKNNIATNAYDATGEEWVNISDKNTQYWTDNQLRFTKHEQTGAYLIEQQDENGNWVAMGYTDQATVANYLKKIESLKTPEPTSNELDPKVQEGVDSLKNAMDTMPKPGDLDNIRLKETAENLAKIDNFQ